MGIPVDSNTVADWKDLVAIASILGKLTWQGLKWAGKKVDNFVKWVQGQMGIPEEARKGIWELTDITTVIPFFAELIWKGIKNVVGTIKDWIKKMAKIDKPIDSLVTSVSNFIIELPDPVKWMFKIGTRLWQYAALGTAIWWALKGLLTTVKIAPVSLPGLVPILVGIGLTLVGLNLLGGRLRKELTEEEIEKKLSDFSKAHPTLFKLSLAIEPILPDASLIMEDIIAESDEMREKLGTVTETVKFYIELDWGKTWEDIKKAMAEKVQAIKDWWNSLWEGFEFKLPELKIPSWLKWMMPWRKETEDVIKKEEELVEKTKEVSKAMDKMITPQTTEKMKLARGEIKRLTEDLTYSAKYWGIYSQEVKIQISAAAATLWLFSDEALKVARQTPVEFTDKFTHEFMSKSPQIQRTILKAITEGDYKEVASLMGEEFAKAFFYGASPCGVISELEEGNKELKAQLDNMLGSMDAMTKKMAKIFEPIIGIFKKIFEKIVKALKESGNDSLITVGNLLDDMMGTFEKFFNLFEEEAKETGEKVTENLAPKPKTLSEWEKFCQQVNKMWGKMVDYLKDDIYGLVSTFKGMISDMSDMLKDLFGPIAGGIGAGLQGFGEAVLKAITGDIAGAVSSLVGIIGSMTSAFKELLTSSEGYRNLQEALKPIVEALANAFGMLFQPLIPLATALKNTLQPYIDAVSGSMAVLGEFLKDTLQPILDTIAPLIEIWAGEITKSRGVMKEFWGMIADFVAPIVKEMITIFKQMVGKGYAFRNLILGLISVVKAMLPIWKLLTNVISFVVQIMNTILVPVIEVVGGIMQGLGNVLSGLIYLIKQIWNAFALAVETIVKIATVGLVKVKLPRLQTGLPYVPEDMAAMLHKGEAVLPKEEAEKYRRGEPVMAGVGAGNTFNIRILHTGDIKSEYDKEEFLKEIADRISNTIRRG